MIGFQEKLSIFNVVVTLFGILVAPLVAVRMSLKQFRSTKWWEKQAEAYCNIIGQLATLQYSLGVWYDESLHLINLSESDKETLQKKYGEARETVDKASAAGAYLISDQASNALATLKKELDKTNWGEDWTSHLDRHYGAVNECISEMRRCSRKDLEIPHCWFGLKW